MENEESMSWAQRLQQSVGFRLAIIGFLILLLLIPSAMITSTIRERSCNRDSVLNDITSRWGGRQTLVGPWLVVPYETYSYSPKGVRQVSVTEVAFFPEEFIVAGTVDTHTRHRGLYTAMLYESHLQLKGHFQPDFSPWHIPSNQVHWQDAYVGFGIPDMKGIRNSLHISWNGKSVPFNPGLHGPSPVESGAIAEVPLDAGAPTEFKINLDLNGSQELSFYPVGKVTRIELSSSWPNPSFSGAFLPEERDVSPKGFKARWQILHLNRNYPQVWMDRAPRLDNSEFGVTFVQPADQYQKTERSVKYALLFLVLTFGTIFFVEILNGLRVQGIQYLLIGLAMVLFYSLLLSVSEHIGFGPAYILSTMAIVGLVGAYAKALFEKTRLAVLLAGIVAGLYGYIYTLLQSEDRALLMGNLGLLAALGAAMYFTRRVDWFRPQRPD